MAINAIGAGGLTQTVTDGLYVAKTGDTMTGALSVPAGTSVTTIKPAGLLSGYASGVGVGTAADLVEKDLFAFTVKANTLVAVGQTLRVTYVVNYAGTVTVKTLRARFGTTFIILNPTTGSPNGVWSTGTVTVTRISNTSWVLASGVTLIGTATQAASAPAFGSSDLTTDLSFRITGQNGTANANDIVLYMAFLEVI